MRIAQIAPLIEPVPPAGYGGTELVVSLLAEELVRRGHDVTLFASGDSSTTARLSSVCARALRRNGLGGTSGVPAARIFHLLNATACFLQAEKFDVIHNHAEYEAMALSNFVETPVLTTIHGQLDQNSAAAWRFYPGFYNTISEAATRTLPDLARERFVGWIHHGINWQEFPFGERPEGYLLCLCRMSPEKGIAEAVAVARRLGRRLILAGKVDRKDRPYFDEQIRPHLDGDQIRFLGEARLRTKRQLYAGADCLLLPLLWDEPFGLTMLEAMACGTPVIAFRRGAAPEIIRHGETGFLVDTVDEMVGAVARLHEIDRQRCRWHVERRFSVERMVDDYLTVYHRLGRRPIAVASPLAVSVQPTEPDLSCTLLEVESFSSPEPDLAG